MELDWSPEEEAFRQEVRSGSRPPTGVGLIPASLPTGLYRNSWVTKR